MMEKESKQIFLFHGTCYCCAEKILKEGLKPRTCLTDNLDVAEYYSEAANDECENCEPVILSVTVMTDNLVVDQPAFDEPLTYYRNNYTRCDDEWYEMLESGEIPSPTSEHDYKTALSVTNSVIHLKEVHPDCINYHN